MDGRAAALINHLGLEPHPEGGYYCRVWISPNLVQPQDQRDLRSAMTMIYFLVVAGNPSRWHRMRSDEIWHFYEGDPLELFKLDPETRCVDRYQLGRVGPAQQPVQVIPGTHWLAARTTGSYSLVGCSVAPGFDFADFQMLVADPHEAARLHQTSPEVADLL